MSMFVLSVCLFVCVCVRMCVRKCSHLQLMFATRGVQIYMSKK